MLVPLVLSFLRPCSSLANSFEQPLIQFFPSDLFINCLYQEFTEFILRRGLMDGSGARLISCWTICCNLAGRFIVVKAALVLSIEDVLGWGLDLNLDDGEERGDDFWRSFRFGGSKISAMFLCCNRDIVKIWCSEWRHL